MRKDANKIIDELVSDEQIRKVADNKMTKEEVRAEVQRNGLETFVMKHTNFDEIEDFDIVQSMGTLKDAINSLEEAQLKLKQATDYVNSSLA